MGTGQHAGPFKIMVRNLDFLLSAKDRRILSRRVAWYYKPVVKEGM